MEFKIGLTRFHISYLFCALLCIMVLFDKEGCIITAFLSVTIHEIAHIFVMKIFGASIESVSFEPFGIIIKKENFSLGKRADFLVSFAGCGANILLCIIFILIYSVSKNKFILLISAVNFLLFLVNILPVKNLDGGDILRLILKEKMSEKKCEKVCKTVSLIVCGMMFASGIALCFKIGFNPSLIILSFYLALSSFKTQSN